MGNIDEKINLAKDICSKRYTYSLENPFMRMYPFTTENIAGYLPLFHLEDKSLLTVGSSGDQAINAILCGCKLIQVYDICPFVEEYYNLKKAAIMVLDREQFIRFFHYTKGLGRMAGANSILFDESIYGSIKEVMDLETACFWDELFKDYDSSLVRNRLFRHDEYSTNVIKTINPYLASDNNYNLLRNKINEATVVFTTNDIFNANMGITFDNIFLSNLATYYKRTQIKELFDIMINKLVNGGKILIAYLYDTDLEDQVFSSHDDIYDLFSTLELFPKGTSVDSFVGVSGIRVYAPHMQDSVLCYKKVKK